MGTHRGPAFEVYQGFQFSTPCWWKRLILLWFCLNQTYFSFANVIYHQIEGCPIGSPVSVPVANLVMEHVETQVFSSLPFPVKMYCRYVDDTFVILKRDNLHDFHAMLNIVHHAIQFTYETEKDGVLPFLDILVRLYRDGSVPQALQHW